jgi:hypothetical protein
MEVAHLLLLRLSSHSALEARISRLWPWRVSTFWCDPCFGITQASTQFFKFCKALCADLVAPFLRLGKCRFSNFYPVLSEISKKFSIGICSPYPFRLAKVRYSGFGRNTAPVSVMRNLNSNHGNFPY